MKLALALASLALLNGCGKVSDEEAINEFLYACNDPIQVEFLYAPSFFSKGHLSIKCSIDKERLTKHKNDLDKQP